MNNDDVARGYIYTDLIQPKPRPTTQAEIQEFHGFPEFPEAEIAIYEDRSPGKLLLTSSLELDQFEVFQTAFAEGIPSDEIIRNVDRVFSELLISRSRRRLSRR